MGGGRDMKRLKAWWVYMDDGRDAFKVAVPAATKKDAEAFVAGNGEVVTIRENLGSFDDGFVLSVDRLVDDMLKAGWGRAEVDLISRTLTGYTEFAQ